MTQKSEPVREIIQVSECDMRLVLDLVANPPPANAKLKAAIAALADNLATERLQDDDGKTRGSL